MGSSAVPSSRGRKPKKKPKRKTAGRPQDRSQRTSNASLKADGASPDSVSVGTAKARAATDGEVVPPPRGESLAATSALGSADRRAWAALYRRLSAATRVLLALVVAGAALVYFESREPTPRAEPVTVDVSLGAGESTFRFAAEQRRMPLLCGCEDPTFSGTPWYGVLLPLESYYLNVLGDPDPKPLQWRMQMMVPEPGYISDTPSSLPMSVTVYETSNGSTSQLFDSQVKYGEAGPSDEVDMYIKNVGVKEVTVVHTGPAWMIGKEKWPLSTLNPPPASEVTLRSEAGARPTESSALSAITRIAAVGERGRSDAFLDIAGRSNVVFRAKEGDRLFIGSHDVPLTRGASVSIVMEPPLTALRMSVTPTSAADVAAYDEKAGRRDVAITGLRHLSRGVMPAEVGGSVAHRIRLFAGVVPSAGSWSAFVQRTTPRKGQSSGWPPIPEQRNVQVYGMIDRYATESAVSTVATHASTRRVSVGESLEVLPKPGYRAGKWVPTLTFSTGSTVAPISISTTARVDVDGEALTQKRPSDTPSTVLYFILAALVTMVLERLLLGPLRSERQAPAGDTAGLDLKAS